MSFVISLMLLSACESEKLQKVESEELEGISLKDSLMPIFNRSCNYSGCHDGSIPPNLTAKSAYNALNLGGYLDVGDPENSSLYKKLGGSNPMPPTSVPSDQYLTKHEKDMILSWIRNGAENN